MLSKLILINKFILLSFQYPFSRLHLKVTFLNHRITYRTISNPLDIVVIGASFAGYHTAYCLERSLPTGYRREGDRKELAFPANLGVAPALRDTET